MSKIMSSLYDLIEEDFLHQDNRESDGNNMNTSCRIITTVVPNQTLQNMRHERLCHILQGAVAKCDSCSRTFTSQELLVIGFKRYTFKIFPFFPI
jgi:hypothetical protein